MYVYILYEIRIVYLSVELSLFPYTYFLYVVFHRKPTRVFRVLPSLSLSLSLSYCIASSCSEEQTRACIIDAVAQGIFGSEGERVCMQHCTNIIMVVRSWGRRAAKEVAANSILSFLYMYINVNTSSPSRFFSVIIIITSHRRYIQRHPSLYLLSYFFPISPRKAVKK